MTMTYRFRNFVIAIVLAITAVTITILYVTSYKSGVDSKGKQVRVFVAARDIPIGTPASKLVSGGYVKPVSVAQSALVPDAIQTPADLRGRSVSQQINAGEQVTTRRFADTKAQGIQTQLSGNLRAVQLAGDANQVLAGTLEAGEHVDVVASIALPEGGTTHYTRVVARNLLVLDAPDKPSSGRLTSGSTSVSVLLAMTDDQAETVFHAVKNGEWTLALRPVTKPRDSAPSASSSWTILTNHGRQSDLLQQRVR
jgi:Flp pilus assembly protein CpaB